MPNSNNPDSISLTPTGTSVPASSTNMPISKRFRITAGGSGSMRNDIYVGKVTGVGTAKVQHSSGYNVWVDGKSVTFSASTNKSVSAVSTTNDTLTVTGHGYVDNQAIAFISSADTPAPLQAGKIYYAEVVDANTIKVRDTEGGPAINLTAAGSGTITVSDVRVFTITHQEAVTADQTHTPLRGMGRLLATTAGGEDIQVCDVVVLLDN
jgi:hypothetical protein